MEIELRAQDIAKSVILKMQQSFDTQLKPHANTTAKLKEQSQEREQCIHELEVEIKEKELEVEIKEKDSSLRAIKIDKEATWGKEDILREQNKELATFLSISHCL